MRTASAIREEPGKTSQPESEIICSMDTLHLPKGVQALEGVQADAGASEAGPEASASMRWGREPDQLRA
eukprot:4660631-Lingulodinium_polyedra.AAC.1